jgi:eukaryotic-like serine/threonine-protein kinase
MEDRGEVLQQDAKPIGDPGDRESGDPLFVRAKARIGSTLRDKWRLDVLLGVGGMATVYAATHRNGSRAAVKILHPETSNNEFVRERFLWEGYVANTVGHEGAVRVIDDDMAEDGSLFLVTELFDGETLEERRTRLGGRIPSNEVLIAIDQLLDVLAAAHAQGIVHRDIKPENVFLTRAGKIKVLDFGIARLGEASSSNGERRTGLTIGTPAYMAPEHAQGLFDEIDGRSDLWSCGAMMFRLLSGRAVHDGPTAEEELTNARTRAAPSLFTVAPEVNEEIARVVDRALAFSKDVRWPDARLMQAAVRQAHFALCGSPITLAEPLTVAETVPDRTLAPQRTGSVAISWGPSSVRSGAVSKYDVMPGGSTQDRRKKGAVTAYAALAVAVLGVGWMMVGARANDSAAAASGALVTVMSPPDLPSVGIAPLPAPEVLAVDEPVAPSARPAPPAAPARAPAPVWRSRPVTIEPSPPPPVSAPPPPAVSQPAPALSSTTPLAPATPAADCRPPYVVDPETGKQRWKLECL